MKRVETLEGQGEILDKEKALRRVAGDEELYAELIESFREEWQDWWMEMEGALQEDRGSEVRRYAHTIKGAADTIGADEVTALARQVEQRASEEAWEEVRERLPELGRALERLNRRLVEEVGA